METQVIKKSTEVSPFIIKRRYLIFLISFLLTSSFLQATCKPKEAYDTLKEDKSASVYVAEGTALFVANGTTVVVDEVVYTGKEVKSLKTKHPKKRVEKLKSIKQKTQTAKSNSSLPPTETFTSKDSKHIFGSNSSSAKEAYVNTNNSNSKFFAVTIFDISIYIIISCLILLISFYNSHFIKALLLGSNFQRPPPAFL